MRRTIVDNSLKKKTFSKEKKNNSSILLQTQNNSNPNRVIPSFPNGVPFEELSKHNKLDDAWISINGRVYDVTYYAAKHPGGSVIKSGFGKEATTLFNKYHPWVNAEYILKDCYIGNLKLI